MLIQADSSSQRLSSNTVILRKESFSSVNSSVLTEVRFAAKQFPTFIACELSYVEGGQSSG